MISILYVRFGKYVQLIHDALTSTAQDLHTRFLLLDVMRAFAVFMMIQGHTVDALLDPSLYLLRENPLWKMWEFMRGLTAPIFLFGSGFAYVLATIRKSEDGRLPRSLVLKRIRWSALLFITGSLMHAPVPTVERFIAMSPTQWTTFWQVDVLRLMAVSLLFLLAVLYTSRRLESIFIRTSIIGALIVIITPLVYDYPWLTLFPEPVAAYISNSTGSFFPLFPFMGYLFAGSAAGSIFLLWKQRKLEHNLVRYFFIGGLIAIAVGTVLDALPVQIYPTYNYWKTSPNLFLFRIGCVLMMWSLVGLAIRRMKTVSPIIPIMGQHTLAIYVSHVVLLYGCAWLLGLQILIGKTLPPLPVAFLIVSITAGSALLAYALHRKKHIPLPHYRKIQLATTAVTVILLLVLS